jgi:hypothetical protein
MAETVRNLRITVRIEGEVAGDDGASLPLNDTYTYNFSDGTGQYQIGSVWQDRDRNLNTTTASLDIDGLTDFQGASTSTYNTVKVLLVKHESDSGDIEIGGAGDWATMLKGTTPELVIKPRGLALVIAPTDGYAVTASTGDVLGLETTANVNFRLLLGVDNAT